MESAEARKIIFIVGNSRSGTSMLRRVLGSHSDIYMLEELHFFERMWSSADKSRELTKGEAEQLAARLLFIQRERILLAQRDGQLTASDLLVHKADAERIVGSIAGRIFAHEILRAFLLYETENHQKTIPCEKTPQDVFYIPEILELFPHAEIINIVRDPRGVMLSQKRKWRRKNMGASLMSRREQRRLRVNYHPITLSKLWNAAVRNALKFKDHNQVHNVIFERLVSEPEDEVARLCSFLEISFVPEMLQIPQVGSSNEADKPGELGIKAERASSWEKGGLRDSEVYFCQNICGDYMQQFGYKIKDVHPNVLELLYYYVSFPVKIALAVIFNFRRMKNVFEVIKRRLK